ncbi:unnamed protein product [Cylicostephanus goldi]|uniref:Uncharacterized protein n=1 Tax=Cylicostephanus goldi TaxID=71465 RepID=A0A3P7N9C3_CYLGO|nr:unnamed protein product [Cylicostephanus goldi]
MNSLLAYTILFTVMLCANAQLGLGLYGSPYGLYGPGYGFGPYGLYSPYSPIRTAIAASLLTGAFGK